MSSFVIGIAGGSGSGKTFFSKKLQKAFGQENCLVIYQDNYYIDQSHRFDQDGGAVNFDHPSSLDFPRLARDLKMLKQGLSVEIPVYDFITHSRKIETIPENPKPIVIVDGILILQSEIVRKELDKSIFFETSEELRFKRRLDRDVVERGRTVEGVTRQFERQVRPMHNEFVEPSKIYATTIINDLTNENEIINQYYEYLVRR